MLNFLKEYCKIISYVILGIVFGFSTFYIVINLYHQTEIARTFTFDSNEEIVMVNYLDKVEKIKNNLATYNINNYNGSLQKFQVISANSKLEACYNDLYNETVQDLITKTEIGIADVYYLRESFENEALSDCLVVNMMWFVDVEKNNITNSYLKNNSEMLDIYIRSLLSDTLYLKKDLLNNSSYFYNTALAASTRKNNTKDGYYDVMNSYDKVANIVLQYSNWFASEVKGAN